MKILIALLALSVPAFSVTVNCTNSAGSDYTAIQSAVSAGGTVTINGPCNVNGNISVNVSGTNIQGGTGAVLTETTNGNRILTGNADNVTINNIDFEGGRVIFPAVRTNITFTNNHVSNVTGGTFSSGSGAMETNGLHLSNFSNNIFDNDFQGGYRSLNPPASNPNDSIQPACWSDFQGWDGVTIKGNTFSRCANDGLHLQPDGSINYAPNPSEVSYNVCHDTHRACYEIQGRLNNFTMKGNSAYNYNGPFYNSFAYSIAAGGVNYTFANNLGSMNTGGCTTFGVAYFLELILRPTLIQGNVAQTISQASLGCPTWPFVADNWGDNTTNPGNTVTMNNNVMCGSATITTFTHEDSSRRMNYVDNANYKNTTSCPVGALATSNVSVPVFTAAPTSFPSGGVGTWTTTQISALPVKWVQFFVDSGTTPVYTQEIQDFNSGFASDLKWHYSLNYDTTPLSNGSHTIKAVATDVLGATANTVSATFTRGTGTSPAVSFGTNPLAFGTVTVSSSSPLTEVITNSGNATLTISSKVIGGTNTGDFAITSSTCGATLAAAATCNVVITFTPAFNGPRSATLVLTDNGGDSPQSLSLTGSGSGGASACANSILPNCDFNSGLQSPWLFAGAHGVGTMTVDSTGACGSLSAHVVASSSVPGGDNIELYQDGLSYSADGSTYTIDFDASATRAQAVNVLTILGSSPFTDYGLGSWQPTITTGCHHYSNSFTTINSPIAAQGRFTTQMDNMLASDAIYMTNVKLTQTSTPITINSVNYVSHSAVQLNFTVDTGNAATSTHVTTSGATAIITAANTFVAGEHIYFSGFTGATFMNGQTASVCGSPNCANPTSTQYIVLTNGMPGAFAFNAADTGIGKLSINVARSRSAISPANCTGATGGLVQPMEIGPTYFGGLTLNMDVAGLTPGAQYNICPEGSPDGGTTWITGTRAPVFMEPLPMVHPALPIAPVTFDPSYPNTAGFAVYNVLSNCSDIGTAYTAAVARQATQGTLINFPAGTICGTAGNFNFAINPVDVNTWHPSDVNISTSQITLGNSSGLAPTLQVGDGVRFAQSYKLLTSYPASNSCEFGQGLSTGAVFFVASVSTGNVVTLACNNNGVPGATMTFTSQGTDTYQGFYWVPANRTLKEIILQPVATINPAGTAITPAWQSKMWTIQSALTNLNVIGPGGAVIVAGNADGNFEPMISHIRIMGAVITTVDSPEAHTTMDPQPWRTMYYSGPQSSHIIFDRTYWHNQPAPNRDNGGIFWEGYQNAIINSHFDELRYFHAEYSGVNVAKTSGTAFTVASGIVNEGAGNIAVSGPRTVTVAGSGSGQIYVGLDMTASNAFTVWTPSGMTASCTGFSCISKVVSGSPNGSCNFSDAWQKNGSGDPSVGMIGCLTVSAGTIGSVIHCADGNGTTESACPWISQYFAEGIQWMVASSGPGPYIFRGNKSICAGLCWHTDAGGGTAHIRGDYTYDRNYFLTPFEWMYNPSNLAANPLSDGLGAYVRQPVEWKGGRRIKFDGNVINGNWNEVEGSAGGVLFTAVDGMGITDVDLTNNTIMHGPGLISYAFNTAGSNYPSTPPVLRFRMRNNLGWDIGNPNFFAGRQALLPAGWIGEGPNGSEDIRVENNSVVGNVGINPQTMWIFDTNAEGVRMHNNILYIEPFRQGLQQAPDEPAVGQACAGLIGKAAADCLLTPTYEWSNNLMIGNGQTPSAVAAAWPSPLVNYFQTGSSSLFTVGWSKYGNLPTNPTNGNPSNFNFNLSATSPWNAGSAGVNDHSKNVGVNIEDLNVAQGLVTLVGTPNNLITTSGFTISYIAPDSGVCYVDWTPTAIDPNVITSFTRVADSGGARARNLAITGTASQSAISYRLECSGNSELGQRMGQVKTR